VLLLAGLLGVGGAVVAITANMDRGSPPSTVAVRGPMPRIDRAALRGDRVTPELFREKVTLVNFWASWCGPCRGEQPELNDAHAELTADNVSFVGVNVLDPEANAAAFRREFEVPYPSILDRAGEFAARFKGVSPQALPTTIVLDREGRVAVRLFGVTSVPELRAVATYLREEA
jgi:thiol-disulfide isomerase/thioredoxin